MIIDKSLIMSDDQAITADAASTVVIDNIKPGGMYDNLWWFVKVGGVVFNTLTSMNIQLQTSDDNFAADTETLISVNKLLADLDAINVVLLKIRVPLGVRRYLRTYYDVVGTDPTTGTIYSALVPDVEEHIAVS